MGLNINIQVKKVLLLKIKNFNIYSHLDKELTNKYKSSQIIINDNVFFTGGLKNICDKNNTWERYPEYIMLKNHQILYQ